MQLIQTAFGTPTDDQLKAMKVGYGSTDLPSPTVPLTNRYSLSGEHEERHGQAEARRQGRPARCSSIFDLSNLIFDLCHFQSLRLQTEGGAPPVLPATTAQAISLLRKVLVYNPER